MCLNTDDALCCEGAEEILVGWPDVGLRAHGFHEEGVPTMETMFWHPVCSLTVFICCGVFGVIFSTLSCSQAVPALSSCTSH